MTRLSDVLDAVRQVESGGNRFARSKAGAMGPYQFMPKTAAEFGLKDPYDETQSRAAAERKITGLLSEYDGDLSMALAAYNAGQGNLKKVGNDYSRIPETRNYVSKVLGALNPISTAQADEDPGDWVDDAPQAATTDDPGDWVDDAPQPAAQEREPDDFSRYVEKPEYASDPFVRTAAGVKAGYDRAALGLADLLGAATPEMQAEQQNTEAAAAAAGGLGSLGKFIGGSAPYLGGGIGAGMGMAAATTPGDIGERMKSAGAALAGGLAGKYIGKAVGGLASSDAAKRLMSMGVQPTVGQGIETAGESTLGNVVGKGIRSLEEASTSLPFLGSITRNSRDRSVGEAMQEALKRAEVPGVSAGGKVGNEAIDALQEGYRAEYQKALSGIEIPKSPELLQRIEDVTKNPKLFADQPAKDEAVAFIQRQFDAADEAMGSHSAESLHEIASSLKAEARSLAGSQDKISAAQGKIFKGAADEILAYLKQHLPADAAKKVSELDKGYANFKILQRAASSVGTKEGEFTPAQLLNAVKAMDRSKDKGRFASGNALMQDLAGPAKKALSDTLGESGTTPRSLIAKLLTGGAAETAAASTALPVYGGLGSAMALGSLRPVQKALLGGYSWQPGVATSLSDLLQRLGKASGGYSQQ